LVEERVQGTAKPPVGEVRVKRLEVVAEFVQASREVRCLCTDDFPKLDLLPEKAFVARIATR
jgi:hypothetical protein